MVLNMKIMTATTLFLLFASANAAADCTGGEAPIDRQLGVVEAAAAPIQTEAHLLRYLEDMPKDSPLRAFSADALSSFVASLKFNEKGLTSLSTIELERELTLRQAHDVLALLGMQSEVSGLSIQAQDAEDANILKRMQHRCGESHKGFTCVGTGSCSASPSSICTPNC